MTHRRDEVATARTARNVGLRRAADITAQLAAIPGWLHVGDPVRLADPADLSAAQQAAALREQLAATYRGIAALDAELDALDGARPEAIFQFLEWSRWLAAVPDATTLISQLIPDPRRMFLGTPPAMGLDTAQRIVDAVAGNGGQVGDGDTFVSAAALADDDVFDLNHTAMIRLDPLPADQSVGILLPVRLETRFRRPAVAADRWRLRVRVYPDPVALAAPAPSPTRAEAELVAACWAGCAGALNTPDLGEASFRSLATAVGGGRAAYLLRTVPVSRTLTGFAAVGNYRESGVDTATYRSSLPPLLTVWGDVGNGLQRLGELAPQLDLIAAQADLGTTMADLRPEQIPDRWWTSYQAALDVGLAVEVEIPDGPGGPPGAEGPTLSVLLVTGLSDQDPRDVLQAHADSGALGMLTPMAPTNTIAGAPAADLGRSPDTWLAVARAVSAGTGNGLGGVLTGVDLLDGVPAADTSLLAAVPPLITGLWPVLWQRWLKDVEGLGIEVMNMAGWAARVVAPLGPFPGVRVGDVPYGLLPAVDLSTWVAAHGDPIWEETIAAVFGTARAGSPDVLAAWATAGIAGGTAAGADPERLLEIIGRIPTSRAVGSRPVLPLALIAVLRAAAFGADPVDVVARWQETAAALDWAPTPLRRYESFGFVESAANGKGPVRDQLEAFLKTSWESLAHRNQDGPDARDVPLLVRLLRQSLLLTQAEVSRLDADHWPTWVPAYQLPVDHAEQLADDASRGGRVSELPPYAQERFDEQYPPDPRVAAVVGQFHDVRTAVRELAESGDAMLDGQPLAAALAAVLDSSSHRVDPWITALGTRRLRRLDARGVRRRLGVYGWVDELSPAADPTPPTTAGLLHAPGITQALAAAVLRDHAIHDDDPRWQLTARSDLVRLAARIGADVRLGIHLSEALGREIERRAGDPAAVLVLRRAFPPRPEQAGRRVCDGLAVLAAPAAALPPEVGPLDDLREVLDTYADLLVADAVHDVVSGRAAQAQESMEAAAGLGAPPELRLLRTQRQGTTDRTTVLIALPAAVPGQVGDPPLRIADPALADLLETELGPAAGWTWTSGVGSVSLAELGLDVADVVLTAQADLDERAAALLGGPAAGGTAVALRGELDRICALLGAQRAPTDLAGDGSGPAAEARARLALLRSDAATVVDDLSALPPLSGRAIRWGLPADPTAAAAALTARLAEIGDESGDSTADFETLATKIRTLLAPASALPVTYGLALPATTVVESLDRDWLEILAAVRPPLARLEAFQLRRNWPAALSRPDALWAVPANGDRQVVVYGPAAGQGSPVAVALLDDWSETVPGTRHTTHAAFGFDAPRSRAPQAVLLAIPPDETVTLTADALPSMVLSIRQQARARMAQPDQLDGWSVAVPTSMVLITGPAGTDLVGR